MPKLIARETDHKVATSASLRTSTSEQIYKEFFTTPRFPQFGKEGTTKTTPIKTITLQGGEIQSIIA